MLARIVAAFVEPAPVAARPSAGWAPPVQAGGAVRPALAVLCAPRDAWLAGAVVGLDLLRRAPVGAVAVCEWGSERRRAGPPLASPSAARLAARLAECGLDATAAGRIVRVALPADEAGATRAAQIAAEEAPCVLAVAGPRSGAVDGLIAAQGRALVAERVADDAGLAALALEDLLEAGVDAACVDLRAPALATALARAGIALLEPLRARLAEAVDAVGAL